MAVDFNIKDKYSFNDLIEIMQLLRSENGCPWDREQTHESIKNNFIEETYEVIEAINKDDKDLLKEELGDALLQVVFHAQIEAEQNSFNINDVSDGICKKLIERHPHIFGDVIVNNTKDVLSNWDDIKRNSKGQKTQTDSMLSVPKELPALMRSEKVQQKASKIGFDWSKIDGAFDKLSEEIDELKQAIINNDRENCFEELGDVLFSAVNVSRFLDFHPEEALTASTEKFIERFNIVENLANDRGIDMKSSSLEVLDKLWVEAKQN
ncbi:MAG: nucleoside triphosphate pyrophosphohydrolase [Oscillospiraceae bacterium]